MAFLPIVRDFFDGPLWSEPRKFSKAEAWIDLLVSAAYEDTEWVGEGIRIRLRKGDLIASTRYLAGRWQWHRTQVRRFLEALEKEGKLTQVSVPECAQVGALLSLSDYEGYTIGRTRSVPTSVSKAVPKTNNREGNKSKKLPGVEIDEEMWKTINRLTGLVATLLYVPDRIEPRPGAEEQDQRKLSEWLQQGRSVSDIEAAIRGAALMRDRGLLAYMVRPGEKATLAILDTQHNGRPLWSVAVDTHFQEEGRRLATKTGMMTIQDVLKRASGET